MSARKAKRFNKRAALPKFKADAIMAALDLQPGQHVADLGSGGGYFTFRFVQAVGSKGSVYAVDIDQDLLSFIKEQSTKKGVSTIAIHQAASDSPQLPQQYFDLIFFRNVTHHIPDRVHYFKELKTSLKPGGKIALIEYDGRGPRFRFHRRHRHYLLPQTLLEELRQAGYTLEKSYDFLPEQSFMIFRAAVE